MSNYSNVEFFLDDGSSVGIIDRLPESNGKYRYEPFRGHGHYEMATQIESGNSVIPWSSQVLGKTEKDRTKIKPRLSKYPETNQTQKHDRE